MIDTFGLQRPILSGWSYGGLVIADHLRIYCTDRIGGVNFVAAAPALSESVLGTLIGPGFYENFEAATDVDLAVSILAIIGILRDCFEIQPSQEEFELMSGINATVSPSVRAHLAAREIDDKDALQKIDIAVRVSHGREDKVVLLSPGEYFLSHRRSAEAS